MYTSVHYVYIMRLYVAAYIGIGVNHSAIVREIPQIWYFPAFPHFYQNIPHF